MLSHHLKVAVRNLARHKTGTLINIVGLAVGIACCILIMLWVQFELSYNNFHDNLDDLYLLASKMQHGSDREIAMQSPPMAAPATLERCPSVVNSTRFNRYGERILKYQDVVFTESIHQADAGFLTMFSFRFLAGDPQTAFNDKNSIVLTRSVAEKYFGDEAALGKILQMDYQYDLRVTGVVEDTPRNSTLRFSSLIPFSFAGSLPGREGYLETWSNLSFYSYVQLHPSTDWRTFNEVINEQAKPDNPSENLSLFVFPFRDLNLKSIYGPGGFIMTLILYSVIAGLILLIACINFMNLATARAGGRAKEVGVRKAIGARQRELIAQFYIESILQAFLGLVLALVLVEQFLPMMRELLYWTELRLDYFGNPKVLLGALVITLITGLVAGSYPALVLSSFNPANVLQGKLRIGTRGGLFRRVLVVLQFTTATILIIGTAVVYQQFDFLCDKPLGYNNENIVYFQMDEPLRPHFDALKADLERHKNVHFVTKANRPLSGVWTNGHGWDWEGRDPQIDPLVTYLGVGLDFQDVFEIGLAEGIFFNEGHLSKGGTDVIVNQAFANMLGEGSAVGKKIHQPDHDDGVPDGYTIIGVVEDFHYKPVYSRIGPLLIELDNRRSNLYAFIKIADQDIPETLKAIEQSFHRFMPNQLLDYSFAVDRYDSMYRSVQTRGNIMRVFAVLAVLLSCLGLFGLASHMTEQRAKEIGIRKVLGASVGSVTLLLTKEFIRWVLVANAIAWPLALVITFSFLGNFSYRAGFDWTIFLQVGALTLALAIVTVSFRSIQAALANPVDAIRRE